MNDITARIDSVKKSIQGIAKRSGREEHSVSLVLATKEVPVERIRQAYEAGHRDFGENRVQELVEKARHLPQDIRWHMIGHLQTNKVKYLPETVSLIHSVDSLRLAEALDREAARKSREVPVLIQCNTSHEISKYGIQPGEAKNFVEQCQAFKRLRFLGLMTIGPLTEDKNRIRSSFRELRLILEELRENYVQYDWKHLSMGMSQDYALAIEEGSTMLRIGTAVFGERSQ